MWIYLTLSFLVCIIGLAIYCFSRADQPKASEIGRIMFGVGLFVFLLGGSTFATLGQGVFLRR